MAKNSLALPDHLVQLLSAAEARHGLPAGTMFSVMQQEIGGQTRFLDDPTTYHYEAGPDGRRVAAHTGKVSTAFGPFGILESTAKDPGFGVAPLANKSIEEQVRFTSDYLAARSKKGGLKAGLAGYGGGVQYADQVLGRLPGAAQAGPVQPVSAAVASTGLAPELPAAPVVASAPAQPQATVQKPIAPVMPDYGQDPWQEFLRTRFSPEGTTAGLVVPATEPPARPRDQAIPLNDDFAQLASMELSTRPSFGLFQGLARLGARRSS